MQRNIELGGVTVSAVGDGQHIQLSCDTDALYSNLDAVLDDILSRFISNFMLRSAAKALVRSAIPPRGQSLDRQLSILSAEIRVTVAPKGRSSFVFAMSAKEFMDKFLK